MSDSACRQVADFIVSEYDESVVSAAEPPSDGSDPSVDFAAPTGKIVAMSVFPALYAEIPATAKTIRSEPDITLEIAKFTDCISPDSWGIRLGKIGCG